jgi:putative serine protease PepD
MSDTPDPYAARPYVPPTDRPDADGEATPAEAPAGQPQGDDPYTHRFEDSTDQSDQSTAPTSDPAPTQAAARQTVPTAASYAADPGPDSTATLPPVPPTSETGAQPPRSRSAVAGLLAAALIGGAAGIGGGAVYEKYLANDQSAISTLEAPVEGDDEDRAPAGAVEQVAARVLPSVVQINVSGGDVGGKGSGIIISSDGEILTNNHVVEVAADDGDDGSITVVFNDGTTGKARVLGRDPLTDTAVIKVANQSGLPAATLGSSGSLRIGQPVIALGSPFGLSGSVTTGIVSALNRPANFADEDGAGAAFPSIQTDAAINPGNSGGPITDMQGRVVGISTGIAASLGGGFDGVAFALPIDLARHVAKNLIAGKKIEHARIGITVGRAVADDNVTQIGAEVRAVQSGSAGDKAGLKVDDIITAVDNHPIVTNDALIATIRGYQPGQTVKVTYLRGGKKRTTEVTLDSDGGNLSQ